MPAPSIVYAILLQAGAVALPSPPADARVWTPVDFPAPKPSGKPALPQSARAAYPREALKRREQGKVVAGMIVGIDGTITRCWIVESSNSTSLDQETCRIALTRIRYTPATDSAGNRMESETRLPVRWVLPH